MRWNGLDATFVGTFQNIRLYRMFNPAVGTFNVTANFSFGGGISVSHWSDVNQQTPISSSIGRSSTGTQHSTGGIAPPLPNGGALAGAILTQSISSGTTFAGSVETTLVGDSYRYDFGFAMAGGRTQTPGANRALDWTTSSNTNCSMAATAINPVQAAAFSPHPTRRRQSNILLL